MGERAVTRRSGRSGLAPLALALAAHDLGRARSGPARVAACDARLVGRVAALRARLKLGGDPRTAERREAESLSDAVQPRGRVRRSWLVAGARASRAREQRDYRHHRDRDPHRRWLVAVRMPGGQETQRARQGHIMAPATMRGDLADARTWPVSSAQPARAGGRVAVPDPTSPRPDTRGGSRLADQVRVAPAGYHQGPTRVRTLPGASSGRGITSR